MAALTPAVAAAERAGVAHRVHRYAADAASASFGDEAVDHLTAMLGVKPEQVFKTLVIAVPQPARPGLAVAVVPVPHRLAPKRAAAALGVPRAALADPAQVARVTGYVLGGVSPLGQKRRLPTVVDSSALSWPAVFCSAGRRGVELELDPHDLVTLTDAVVADITA